LPLFPPSMAPSASRCVFGKLAPGAVFLYQFIFSHLIGPAPRAQQHRPPFFFLQKFLNSRHGGVGFFFFSSAFQRLRRFDYSGSAWEISDVFFSPGEPTPYFLALPGFPKSRSAGPAGTCGRFIPRRDFARCRVSFFSGRFGSKRPKNGRQPRCPFSAP